MLNLQADIVKIGFSPKPNHHLEILLAQISETLCSIDEIEIEHQTFAYKLCVKFVVRDWLIDKSKARERFIGFGKLNLPMAVRF
jgi:hypothetical protein